MADVTGRIGDQDVALDNAATEATLKALLAAISNQKTDMSKLINLASRSGMDPRAIAEANKNISAMGVAGQVAGKLASTAMGGLSKGALVLGGVIGDLASSALKTVGNLTGLADELLAGKASVSGLFTAFKDLPLGLGLVAGLFEKMAKMQEDNLVAYREISKSGINLGGDLNDVRLQALAMGTTLDGFARLMKENSEAFAGMGGSANDGATNFMRFSKELRSSRIGSELGGLGFTLEDISQSASNYIKISGGRTAEEMRNTKALVESTGSYMKQLDMLSQITGKSREEQEKLLAEESANAAWQSYLQTLEAGEREKAIKSFNEALQTGGKGAASYLRSTLMGIPPLDEAGQTFMAMAQNGTKALDQAAASVKDQSKTVQDLDKDLAGFRVGLGQDGKNLSGPLGSALLAAGGAQADFTSKAIATQNQLNTQNVKSVDDEIAFRKKLQAEADERAKSAAAAAAESEKALKDLGAELMGSLMPVFKALSPVINSLAQEFINFATANMPALKQALEVVVKYISEFVKNLFSEDGRKKIANDLSYYFKLMMIELKQAVLPKIMYDEKDAAADREKLRLEKEVFDKRAEASRLEMEQAAKLKALEKETDEKKKAAAQAEAEKAKAQAANLRKEADTKSAALNPTVQQEDLTDWTSMGGLAANEGGIFKGPESGYMVQLHGHEAVVPMAGLEKILKNPLANVTESLPQLDQGIGDKVREVKSEPMGIFGEMSKTLAEVTKAIALTPSQLAEAFSPTTNAQPATSNEILVKELQTLNKQTAQMLYYIKESVDFDRKNLDAVRGLNGNLFV